MWVVKLLNPHFSAVNTQLMLSGARTRLLSQGEHLQPREIGKGCMKEIKIMEGLINVVPWLLLWLIS